MKYQNPDYSTIELYLRRYLELKDHLADLQSTSVTPNYTPMPGGNDVKRTTENIATRQLEKYEQDWVDAIDTAIALLRTTRHYDITMRLITKMYFTDYLSMNDPAYKGKRNERLLTASKSLGLTPRQAQVHKRRFFEIIWRERVRK